MNLLSSVDRLAGAFGLAPKATGARRVQLPPWAQNPGYGNVDDDLDRNYERQAQQMEDSPPFFAALSRVIELAATSKLDVFTGPDEDATPIADHPFMALLRLPAPGMEWLGLDKFSLIESVAGSLALAGDAFIYLGGRADPSQPPGMLIPLRPDRVELLGAGNVVYGYRYSVNGQQFTLSLADIVHIKRWSPSSDVRGLGQGRAAFMAADGDISAQRHNRAIFRNQARLSTVIESDLDFIDDDQRKVMERWFVDKFSGGPDKAGQVAFLWAGFKARDMGMSQRDAEYIAGRKMNREDIFMALGVHPALLLSDDVPLANVRSAEYLMAKYTIEPLLTRICGRFNAEVLPLYGDGHTLRALDVVPRDTQQELQQHQTYLDRAVMTINEVRADLGMKKMPWGDVTWPEYQATVGKPEPEPERPALDRIGGADNERRPMLQAGGKPDERPVDEALDMADTETPKMLSDLPALFLAAARVVARG